MASHFDASENRIGAKEIKFLVSPGRAETIRQWARQYLEPDPHGGGPAGDIYRISSLYLDTPLFDVYRRNGSFGRAKYRIRQYDGARKAFLERKLKTCDLVRKQRSAVKLKELQRLEDSAADRNWAGSWFHRRILLRGLNPVCRISYIRTARAAPGLDGEIRLTLDQDLSARRVDEFAMEESYDGAPLTDGQVIVEMKYRCEMPPEFTQLVDEFGLVRKALSKYRLAAAALGLAPEEAKGCDSGMAVSVGEEVR